MRKGLTLWVAIVVLSAALGAGWMLVPDLAGAQQQLSATRSFSPNPVPAGGNLVVTIAASGYGSFGAVEETLPTGFTYESTELSDSAVFRVNDQTVRFSLFGTSSFTYTVTASDTGGSYSFSGVLIGAEDANGVRPRADVGETTPVTVTQAPAAAASRSFSPAVETGEEVVVTINVSGYGASGTVAETLPSGFAYVESSLADDSVTESGQEVTFTLAGETSFTYTVTASNTAGGYTFSGVLTDEDDMTADVGGSTRVTVTAPPPPAGFTASRSFSPASVETGEEVVVTINVAGYGAFGRVVETLPSGFAYVDSSLADTSVEQSGQEVTFKLLGETSFTYTVTASSTAGSHTFSGKAINEDLQERTVSGAARIRVGPVPTPTPTPTPSNRAPAFPGSSTTRSIDENSADGANVGARVRATDADRDRLTYSLTGTDAGSFTINSSSGQIMVGTGTMLNYETKASYTVTVRATDGRASDTITVNITVTNVDDMGEVTFWVGSVALTMPPQVDEAITGLVVDPDGGVMGETWQWAKSMDKTDMNSWMDIQGATDAMYTPMAADDGYYLQVTAMYEDAEGAGKTAMGMTGSAVGATGGALAMYDDDKNGSIDKSEYQAAAEHYLRGMIDKATFQEVAELYLRG